MNHFVKSIGLALVLSTSALAANNVKKNLQEYHVPEMHEASFDDASYLKEKKEWSKLKRKIASDMTFNGGDLSKDFQTLRDEWLKCKTGNEVEALLKKSQTQFATYSEDTKYFLAQLHTAIPLRGIIWRLVPLFEQNKGFFGNKSTHVTAVQAIRSAVSGLKMFLPTNQTDAAIQFFTEPSVVMSKADQFKSVVDFQNFMVESFLPVLSKSITHLVALAKTNTDKIFVWDNKMAFGRGTFEDEVQRYVGHGPAEMNFVVSTMFRAYHDILVYSAFNQDHAVKVAGEIGAHLGIDSSIFSSKKEDLGMTDQERVAIMKGAAKKHRFLEIRNYGGGTYGSQLLKHAYICLKNSVIYSERSFDFLQNRDASKSMSLNPILFQLEVSPNIDKGIKNMRAAISGPAEVRDPVSGDTVTINVPAFYNEPPQSLSVLMATNFEGGEPRKVIKNKKGDELVVRNYLRGRSVAWDNNAWKKYVPSSAGKNPGYMAEARRIIHYSFGTSLVFGLPDMFVH
jgi:sulfur relay (sulfurtransferase) DsrC/TusE family protein